MEAPEASSKTKRKEKKLDMEAVNNLHMKTGDGESSYANNSFLQETIIMKTLPVLKHTIKNLATSSTLGVARRCFKIADMGCSSGPNTLLVASNIIDIIHEVCKERNIEDTQYEVYLNDLIGNDFNTLFKMLPNFHAKLKKGKGESFGPCFVSACPGSFYGRVFSNESMHLVHSSYSLQWLSQVPKGLENNKVNVYMAKTSPQNVFESYRKQFHTDFMTFLQMRSQELVRGGLMVLTFIGRSIPDPTCDDCCCLWELLALSLCDMLKEGLIQESDLNSFNVPYYNPCEDEVLNIIQNEGSFSLDTFHAFQCNWDPYDTDYTSMNDSTEQSHNHAKNVAKIARAATEPLLTSHFGSFIIDVVFKRFEKHVARHLAFKKTRHFNIFISLTKK